MKYSKVSFKGLVVIPSELRKKYHIKAGTNIYFSEDKGELKLVPITHQLIRKNFGILGTKGRLLKSLAEEKKKERYKFVKKLT